MPGLVVTNPRPQQSGPFDSVLCSAVVWAVIEGRSAVPAWTIAGWPSPPSRYRTPLPTIARPIAGCKEFAPASF